MDSGLLVLLQQGEPVCESLGTILPSSIYGTSVTLVILCSLLCATSVLGNIITMLTIYLHKELHSSSNILLAFLSGLDLFTGLTVIPVITAYHANNLTSAVDCGLFFIVKISLSSIVALSFITLGLVTADRYLAVFKALRYKQIVTAKRVICSVVTCWSMYLVVLAILYYFDLRFNKSFVKTTVSIAAVIFLSFCSYVYGRLFLRTKTHMKAIAAQEFAVQHIIRQQEKHEKRHSITTFFLTGVFIVCLLPELCAVIVRLVVGFNVELSVRVYVWADFVMVLNSSLNTVIYFWRNSRLRNCALTLLSLKRRHHTFDQEMALRRNRIVENVL